MLINMDDSRITSIAQLKDFLNGSQRVVVSLEESTIKDKYSFIEKTVRQFLYQNLKKKENYFKRLERKIVKMVRRESCNLYFALLFRLGTTCIEARLGRTE